VPWAEHIRVEDLILVGACLLIPCFLLAKVVAPSSKKTAADAAKDRDRMMRAAVKRQKREMKKRKGRGSSAHVSSHLGAYDVASEGGEKSAVRLLVTDPLCPHLAALTLIIGGLDALYGWQFLTLMEAKLSAGAEAVAPDEVNNEIAKYLGIVS